MKPGWHILERPVDGSPPKNRFAYARSGGKTPQQQPQPINLLCAGQTTAI
jgi:hypothetical protein